MSLGQSNTFDATTAGLKFTRPGVTLTSQNMAINGGLSFDLQTTRKHPRGDSHQPAQRMRPADVRTDKKM